MATRAPSAAPRPSRRGRDGAAPRVLVVGRDRTTSRRVSIALQEHDWRVLVAPTVASAIVTAGTFHPDVVVVDLASPTWKGLEVLDALRSRSVEIPVLFLTDSDEEPNGLAGLTARDLRLTKPFGSHQLLACVRALLPRPEPARETLVVGDLQLDPSSHRVQRGTSEIHLTATEFALLEFLMRNARGVLSKAQILDRVWDHGFGGQPNVVELYISYLRKKIDVGRDPMIHTVRGFGYVLKPAG